MNPDSWSLDKEGALGIWDARAPVEEDEEDAEIAANEEKGGGKYWRIQLHWPANAKSSISSIKIDPVDPHNVGFLLAVEDQH
jgi:WD repeat-containing protein 76